MVDTNKFVLPHEVFAAIEHAKSIDHTDIYGDKAFRVSADGRESKGCTFRTFEISKQLPNKTWVFIPCHVKFANLITKCNGRAKVVQGKMAIDGVRLMFNKSSVFGTEPNVERFGEAICAINEARDRILNDLLAKKKIIAKNKKIVPIVVTETSNGTAIDDPLFRLEVPWDHTIQGNAKIFQPTGRPKDPIYDVTKRKKNWTLGCKMLPWELLTVKGAPVTYATVNEVIRAGSSCSGIADFGTICTSTQGLSSPAKVWSLAIKPSGGFKIDAASVFTADDIAAMDDAKTEEPIDEESTETTQIIDNGEAADDIEKSVNNDTNGFEDS